MKKQYIFLVMIWIILYILFLIINFTYKEYKINSNIEYISKLNEDIKKDIQEAQKIIKYKSSKAYRNKILKEQQSYKNKWENVIYLTSEKKYNKYTKETVKEQIENNDIIENSKDNKIDNMNIFERWQYLIFKKDIY